MASVLYAYKVTHTNMPDRNPLGSLFLIDEDLGYRHTFERYDHETLRFEPTFSARRLGRITARSERGRIRQLLALRGAGDVRRRVRSKHG